MSSFEIVTIPCLNDNYAFLLIHGGDAVVVDVPDAAPILDEVAKHGVNVTSVLLTHHHADHIQGVPALLDGAPGATVYAARADEHRIPGVDVYFDDGDVHQVFDGVDMHVMDVSGHTIGHVAFHVPDAKVVFTADSLMALGCGRLFEGTADQMWASLSKLAALPPDTVVCSGHEYTAANARFALTIEPENQALRARATQIAQDRSDGKPTVPSLLSLELETNPFLRAGLSSVKSFLGMADASDVDVFAEIRRRKDMF